MEGLLNVPLRRFMHVDYKCIETEHARVDHGNGDAKW